MKECYKKNKYRLSSWWWGKYIQYENGRWKDEKDCTFPLDQVDTSKLRPYIEEQHGLQAAINGEHLDEWEIVNLAHRSLEKKLLNTKLTE